jgi:hypothetical protein
VTRVVRVRKGASSVIDVAQGKGKPRAKPRQLEHEMQVALFAQLDMDPRTKHALIYAVPNFSGRMGKLTAIHGARLKAEGRKRGVPDINVDEARGGYHGLRIELKAGKNRPSPEQADWIARLQSRGYSAVVCKSRETAFDTIVGYLEMARVAP